MTHNKRLLWALLGVVGTIVMGAVIITSAVITLHRDGPAASPAAQTGTTPPPPPYVAQLYHDGYTDANIKEGVSQNEFVCTDYAIGDDGDGYGELVVQCPDHASAYTLALNIAGRLDGTLVIKTGPLSIL